MRQDRVLLTACRRSMLLPLFALGLAASAPTAQAQAVPDKPAAAAAQPGAPAPQPSGVEGVTVSAPRPGLTDVPPDKAAGYAEEAAKNAAWKGYRESTPPLTSNPNDQSKDFPGLQAYIPN